jgi:2-keto-3-deoxy-L-rhamnonate aldolase RhmA
VDVLFMGLGDLAASFGQNGVITGDLMDAARRQVLAACRDHGKVAGVFAPTMEYANQYIKEGFTFVAIGNDVKYLSMGLAQCLSKIKKLA